VGSAHRLIRNHVEQGRASCLIFDLIVRRSRSAGIVLAALSALGLLNHEQIHPLRPHEHVATVTAYVAFIAVDLYVVYVVVHVVALLASLRAPNQRKGYA